MNNDFASVKYAKPPTKQQLAARIAKGEILQGSDAVLACEFGLGIIRRTTHMTLVLVPNNQNKHAIR
jgi:hypothetical protein